MASYIWIAASCLNKIYAFLLEISTEIKFKTESSSWIINSFLCFLVALLESTKLNEERRRRRKKRNV